VNDMRRARLKMTRTEIVVAAILACISIGPAAESLRAQARKPADLQRFKAVREWTLTYAYEYDDPYNYVDSTTGDDCIRTALSHSQRGTFTLRQTHVDDESVVLEGSGLVSMAGERRMECTSGAWHHLFEDRGRGDLPTTATMTLDLDSGVYSIDFEPAGPTVPGEMRRKVEERRPGGRTNDVTRESPYRGVGPFWPAAEQRRLPETDLIIAGTYTLEQFYRDRGANLEEERKRGPTHGTFEWRAMPAGFVEPCELQPLLASVPKLPPPRCR